MKTLSVYLNFNNNCEEALQFYKECFNGEIVSMMRMGDMPPSAGQEELKEKFKNSIMHSEFKADGLSFMASDNMGYAYQTGTNVTLNVNLTDQDEQTRLFEALSRGGKVSMPLDNTFWGARFGMLTDKFGINWMLNCELAKN